MTLEFGKKREEAQEAESMDGTLGEIIKRVPCGILRCTYEKHPKAIYANNWMFQFLGTDENSEDWQEFIQQNVFFMIPFEERDLFKRDLQRVAENERPIPVKHWIRNCSGGKNCFVGWVQAIHTAQTEKEYVFFYVPISETYFVNRNDREKAYEAALECVFDAIFRIEWETRILECIHAKPNIQLPNTPGVQMICDDRAWDELRAMVCEEDQDRVQAFFTRDLEASRSENSKPNTRRIDFRIIQENAIKEIMMIAVEMEERDTLFCCREITEEKNVRYIADEVESIRTIGAEVSKEERHYPVKSTTYRLSRGYVYLQTGSDKHFGFGGMSLGEFLQYREISKEEFQMAIQEGKAVLAGDLGTAGAKRNLYAVQRAGIAKELDEYLLFLYEFEVGGGAAKAKKPRVRIHTFGYFDVFVDGKPIVFRYEKSKEMLAILVDRKGSFVSNPYFISCLWGDEVYSEKVRSRCRQVAYRMMDTLKQYGIEDIIEKVDGHRRIIPEKIECDYFDYISGEKTTGQMFNGAYMSDYSWGEETLSMLLKSREYGTGED